MKLAGTAALLALALPLGGSATAAAAAEPSPLGEWVTGDGDARVRIEPCAGRPDKLCGRITSSVRPPDAPEGPLLDRNNAEPALRSRPIEGLPLLAGFEPDSGGGWSGGTIYDPRNGKTYRSKMRLRSADRLDVSGCVLFVCLGDTWTRYGP